MRTKLVLQVALLTTEAFKHKSVMCFTGRFCSIVIIATVMIAMGCTRADKEHGTPSTSDGAQKTTVDKGRSDPQGASPMRAEGRSTGAICYAGNSSQP
jgi:hypothetical protein